MNLPLHVDEDDFPRLHIPELVVAKKRERDAFGRDHMRFSARERALRIVLALDVASAHHKRSNAARIAESEKPVVGDQGNDAVAAIDSLEDPLHRLADLIKGQLAVRWQGLGAFGRCVRGETFG